MAAEIRPLVAKYPKAADPPPPAPIVGKPIYIDGFDSRKVWDPKSRKFKAMGAEWWSQVQHRPIHVLGDAPHMPVVVESAGGRWVGRGCLVCGVREIVQTARRFYGVRGGLCVDCTGMYETTRPSSTT